MQLLHPHIAGSMPFRGFFLGHPVYSYIRSIMMCYSYLQCKIWRVSREVFTWPKPKRKGGGKNSNSVVTKLCNLWHVTYLYFVRIGSFNIRVSSQNGLTPFWSIWDIWDLSCWNIKKIIRKCVILLIITSKIFLYIQYNDKGIIRKVLFCIIRWCPYFKKVNNGA